MGMFDRIKSAWNAFRFGEANPFAQDMALGPATYTGRNPDRIRGPIFNERSIISSIYTRVAVDAADVPLEHVRVDSEDRYLEDIPSKLNQALKLDPNLDQGPRSFRQDIILTLFDKGVACIVPVDTIGNPTEEMDFDVVTLRVGSIINWYPRHVRVSLYNEKTAKHQEILLEKRFVAIVENPLYGIMNEPNSTLQRLIRKLGLLDTADELSASGKLDLIIQLPYVVKSEARRQQADQRRRDIEFQLKGSQYGIAYTDGTEKITQLNRPAENNLLTQVQFLVAQLYTQLGLTEDIMNGTATEAAMLNYYNRTIHPLIQSIAESMQKAFLGTRLVKDERIMYFRDPFKFVPVSSMADIADKFGRNEVMTSNEMRQVLGLKPSKDPKADKLMNSNMPQPQPQLEATTDSSKTVVLERNSQNGS